MYLIFLILLIVIGVFVITKISLINKNDYSYVKYEKVITRPEQVLYNRLKKAYPQDNYTISYQVALNRLVKPKHSNNKKRFELFKKIGGKSIDFVITDLSCKPLFLIELDDNSHKNPTSQKNDLQKNKILASAGLQLYRFNVKNIPTIEELKNLLKEENIICD